VAAPPTEAPAAPLPPEEVPPPSQPVGGGALGTIGGIAGKLFTMLSIYPIAKTFVDVARGKDDGTIPFLAVPGQPLPIANPKRYFDVHMKRERGLDVKKMEGQVIEEGNKSYIIQNGLPVPYS
jgi:hypothetical protein